MNKWISVSDDLPKYDERVLIIRSYPHNEINIAYRDNSLLQHHWKYPWDDRYTFSDVIYWMKLPEFPQ